MLGVQELLIILVIVVMIFGASRIPEIMGGLGKGIRSFKKAVEGEDVSEPPAQVGGQEESSPQGTTGTNEQKSSKT